MFFRKVINCILEHRFNQIWKNPSVNKKVIDISLLPLSSCILTQIKCSVRRNYINNMKLENLGVFFLETSTQYFAHKL